MYRSAPVTLLVAVVGGVLAGGCSNNGPASADSTVDQSVEPARDLLDGPDLPGVDGPADSAPGDSAEVDLPPEAGPEIDASDEDAGDGCRVVSEIVESTGDVGWHTSLVVDDNGALHVAYYDVTNQDLRYATDASGSWVAVPVDQSGDVGLFPSLTLSALGSPQIVYYDHDSQRPKLAQTGPGGWVTSHLDSTTGVGTHVASAAEPNGTLHAVYYDAVAQDLRYARLSSGSWTYGYVENSPDAVGTHASLAANAGTVHVAYRDASNQDLRFAKASAGSPFSVQAVDTQGDVGLDTSLALDGAGTPHIVYHDKTNGLVKHAVITTTGVMIETIASGGVGWYTAIRLDKPTGLLHVAYYDYTLGVLRYATKQSGIWTTILVDGLGSQAGWDVSMALKSGTNPGTKDVHLTYYDTVKGDIKHATLMNCP